MVSARLCLSLEEVATILDTDLSIPLGIEPGTTKIHRLFFDKEARYWFVAVQDEKNGEVVTVLPIEYHNRWRIDPDTLVEARDLIIPPPKKHIGEPELPKEERVQFRLSAEVWDIFKSKRKIPLGKFDPTEYGSTTAEECAKNPSVYALAEERLAKTTMHTAELIGFFVSKAKGKKRIQITTRYK